MPPPAQADPPQTLVRGIGLDTATALNMIDMIGVGPFITMPLVVAAMGGPQALLGWILGALLAICDGLVWAELGAAMPGSGGSYVYLREIYGPKPGAPCLAGFETWEPRTRAGTESAVVVARYSNQSHLAGAVLRLQRGERPQASVKGALYSSQPGVPGKPVFGLLGWKPVRRGLVEKPEQWRWSSFRAYAYGEEGGARVNDWTVLKPKVRKPVE